jgi:hypothetical protein
LNNTPGTAFAIAGTWWNLSMSADGRYAITAGGNSGTPIALKLQSKDSIAKNVLAKGMKIYEEGGASPVLQYLGGDGTNYNYLYPSVFDNWFVFRSFRTGGFVFMDTTGTNSCTISNTGLITTNGGLITQKAIQQPFISPNIRPWTSSPSIAETIDRAQTGTGISTIPVNRVYFTSIYLVAGMVITGMSSCHRGSGAVGPASYYCLWDSAGTLLRNVATSINGIGLERHANSFSSTYTIPTSGYYFVGELFAGSGITYTLVAGPAGGFGLAINNTAAPTTLANISSGFYTMGATPTNIATTGLSVQVSVPYFSVY